MRDKLAAYLDSKKGLWSPTTLMTAKSKLAIAIQTSSILDPKTIFETLKDQGRGLYYIKTLLIVCREFEKWALGSERVATFLKENSFVFRNAYQEKTSVMTAEEFESYLDKAKTSPSVYNFLVLIGRCGLRASEARSAKWADFDSKNLSLIIKGKGGKVRPVPMSAKWIKEVWRLNTREFLCGEPQSYQSELRRFFSAIPHKAHDFRRFFATQVANHKELTIMDARDLLGHSSLLTTQRYVRSDWMRQHRVLVGEK